jgi:hypothetical protein
LVIWVFAWQNLVTRPALTAPAAVGLTIPILAFLIFFSISRAIRDPVGGTITPPEQGTRQIASRRPP